jgi:hypothetical protein
MSSPEGDDNEGDDTISVKNHRTITKFEFDLRILMTYLHMQFQPYTYIQTKVRELKLKISSRYIALSKIIGP